MSAESYSVMLTDQNFRQEVLEYPELVLVEFVAHWSGSCKIVASLVHQLSDEFEGRFKLGVIDVDQNKKIVKEFRVQTQCLPALVFFWRGVVVDQITGVFPKKILQEKLIFLLESRNGDMDQTGY